MRLRKSGAILVKGCSTPFLHVAMDQGSRIIRRVASTPANANETRTADALICEATVYADKAYNRQAGRVRPKEMGIRDGIMRRHNRWLRLGPWAVGRNAVNSHLRAPVEPLFALLKRVSLGLTHRRKMMSAPLALCQGSTSAKQSAGHCPSERAAFNCSLCGKLLESFSTRPPRPTGLFQAPTESLPNKPLLMKGSGLTLGKVEEVS
jgi:hypothetical protein